jgi:hypothetical protein
MSAAYSPMLAAYEAGRHFLAHMAEPDERQCIGCGCTQDNACIGTTGNCWWVTDELCSMCSGDHPEAPRRNAAIGETLL